MKYIIANSFWFLKLWVKMHCRHNSCFPISDKCSNLFSWAWMRKHFSPLGVNNPWQYVITLHTMYIYIFMVSKHASESFNSLIDCVYLCVCFLTAPSVVPIMHQVSSTSRSFSLSWPPPEQPNGIILDYEIRYYDKVEWDDKCLWVWMCMSVCFLV